MLLLKKKKYAAVKEQIRDGKVYKVLDYMDLSRYSLNICIFSVVVPKYCKICRL